MLIHEQPEIPGLRPPLALRALAIWCALATSASAQSARWFAPPATPASNIRLVSAEALQPAPEGDAPAPGIGGEGEQGTLDSRQYFDQVAPALPTNCCKGCPSFWYATPEYLGVSRGNRNSAALSNGIVVGDLDEYEPGFRLTVGRQRDCLDAIEMVYAGVYGAGDVSTASSPIGALQSAFGPGVGAFNLDDFNNATLQTADYEWNLTNLELNQRQWGWDIISSVWGIRYINLREDLTFTSFPNPPATFGQYQVKTQSNLFGYHFGGDMLYPIGPAWNVGGKIKLGGFVASLSQETTVINNSTVVTQNSANEINVAFLGEFGVFTTYRVHPRCTVRAGYEMWYLWNVALATDQIDYNPRPGMAGGLADGGDVFLGMYTLGAEFQW